MAMMTKASHHLTAGYSMVDHQLDPLIDVAHTWVAGLASPTTLDERRSTAALIAETLHAAADYVEAMGTSVAALDMECPKCCAPAREQCWTINTDVPMARPHNERRALEGQVFAHEMMRTY